MRLYKQGKEERKKRLKKINKKQSKMQGNLVVAVEVNIFILEDEVSK